MDALISELSEPAAVQVMRLWRQLNQNCGLEGIFSYPNPHFTWFSAETLEVERCKPILKVTALEHAPFEVHTTGLGFFGGEGPVLYLPVVKSPQLMRLHRSLWDQLTPYGKNPNAFYSPDEWVPHISLALRDLTMENLPCALQAIGDEPLEIANLVDSISLVKSDNQSMGETLAVYTFSPEGSAA